ncbi:MAG TPA: response regulator transcription factor [Firmicutes bacterium]|jgi:DNA-binding NarL/FixJ family response regulator|nr:response regulator transcription factor [Bacillota bacterium]HOQ23116.1 response regulator transcription factor [Bacillota bacterium]HPT67013.1 response regulator transcription factor [Bacillota bacterium]
MSIRILLADDHELLRQGLIKLLSIEPDFEVVGEAKNGQEALELALKLQPDVVLMDVNMPALNGIEATKRLREVNPAIRILALTVCTDDQYVHEIIRAGATGYVLKDVDSATLFEAIRVVAEGEAYIQPSLLVRLLDEFKIWRGKEINQFTPEELGLTEREMEIVQLISQGENNKTIAEKLFISEKTVKNHVSSILRKLDLTDRTQLAVYALKKGLVK